MKNQILSIVALTLFSLSGFAGQIGPFEVKSCSLIVARDTSQELISELMVKGYRPMNLLGVKDPEAGEKDLAGFPYLEESSLNIKIVGQPKALYSVQETPNCIEN